MQPPAMTAAELAQNPNAAVRVSCYDCHRDLYAADTVPDGGSDAVYTAAGCRDDPRTCPGPFTPATDSAAALAELTGFQPAAPGAGRRPIGPGVTSLAVRPVVPIEGGPDLTQLVAPATTLGVVEDVTDLIGGVPMPPEDPGTENT